MYEMGGLLPRVLKLHVTSTSCPIAQLPRRLLLHDIKWPVLRLTEHRNGILVLHKVASNPTAPNANPNPCNAKDSDNRTS